MVHLKACILKKFPRGTKLTDLNDAQLRRIGLTPEMRDYCVKVIREGNGVAHPNPLSKEKCDKAMGVDSRSPRGMIDFFVKFDEELSPEHRLLTRTP